MIPFNTITGSTIYVDDLTLFFFKLNAGGGLGGGGSKKGPNFQGEALRQMLSQHMVR